MTRNTVAASALEACHGAAAQRAASAWATAGACPGGGCGRPVACNRGLAAKAALAPGAAWVTAVPDPHPASSTPALAILISRARVRHWLSLMRLRTPLPAQGSSDHDPPRGR